MEINEKNLAAFRKWLAQRGRSDGTADLYIYNLISCATDKKGLTNRLVARKLSPNSLRTNRAALRAWALFSEDESLRKKVNDIRLPPARRVRTKEPLDRATWRKAIDHLESSKEVPQALRYVILIMAKRGMRVSDVLRIQRDAVKRAISSGKLAYEGKGRKRIEISAKPIMAELEALNEHRDWEKVSDLVSDGEGSRAAALRVWRHSRRSGAKAGVLEMNPHRYRHTYATNFLAELQGDPNAILKLQRFMGWESMNTAARYVDHIEQDELDAVGDRLAAGLKKR